MIVENSIISSPLWSIVRRFRLTENMRANPGEEDFKSFLLDMGDGKLPLKNSHPFPESIDIPYNFITSTNIVDDIFPQDHISQHSASLIKRSILCPTNKEANFYQCQYFKQITWGRTRVSQCRQHRTLLK